MSEFNEKESELVDLSLHLRDGDAFYDIEGNGHTFLAFEIETKSEDVVKEFYAHKEGICKPIQISKFGVLIDSENKLPSYFLAKPSLIIPTEKEINFKLEFIDGAEDWEVSNDGKKWLEAEPALYLPSVAFKFFVYEFKEDSESQYSCYRRVQDSKVDNADIAISLEQFLFARKIAIK